MTVNIISTYLLWKSISLQCVDTDSNDKVSSLLFFHN